MAQEFLSVFTPSRTPPDKLEKIFVQRHALLNDAVERVRESAQSGNKHHLLFVGTRGSGKTHFVTLLVHRLSQAESLEDQLQIAWLNEDETSTTVLEVLLRIYQALAKRYPVAYPIEDLEPAYALTPEEAQEFVGKLLLEKLGGRTPLLIVENLDLLFSALGESGQRELRAYFQENPVFAIVATAQALTEDLSQRKATFFGFFQTEHMKPLNLEEASSLLRKVARLNDRDQVGQFLQSAKGRARVRALHHLSGGNHRVFMVLSQFVTRENIEDLVVPFQKMVDELTPYYQERVRSLPPMQRKIVEYLCKVSGTVPVKEMARQLFATHQTVSNQLKDLRHKGYVQSSQRGRESLYEVSEPLMRICVEVKENQSYAPLRLLVDFVRVWYESRELFQRRDEVSSSSVAKEYFQSACERHEQEGNLRQQILVSAIAEDFEGSLPEEILKVVSTSLEQVPETLVLFLECLKNGNRNEAVVVLDEAQDIVTAEHFMMRAAQYAGVGESEKELADYNSVIELEGAPVEQVAKALLYRGITYGNLGEGEKELADYGSVIELEGAPVEQVAMALLNRGVRYGSLGENGKALADYNSVIELEGAPVEQVAMALLNRGVRYGSLGESEKELADYGSVIELEGAPVEQVAMALLNRGVSYGSLGENEKALADYGAVIELEGAPVEQVSMALNNRACEFSRAGSHEEAEKDHTENLKFSDLPHKQRVFSHIGIAEMRGRQGRWPEALESFESSLLVPKDGAVRFEGDFTEWFEILFQAGLSTDEVKRILSKLIGFCEKHNALVELGNDLPKHLSRIQKTEFVPALLERWSEIWKEVARGVSELEIPLRIFEVGIRFLVSKEQDEGILLDLRSEERELLKEILGLDKD